jgi:hypothetical protein
MATKRRLHQLVDDLPDTAAQEAERYLSALAEGSTEGVTAEDRAWLTADLSRRDGIEPFDWGPDGPPKVKPIRYGVGGGFVVEGRGLAVPCDADLAAHGQHGAGRAVGERAGADVLAERYQ